MYNRFIFAVLTYAALSIASQYGSAVLIPLEWITTGLFTSLSAVCIIPLLDCSRSFTQGIGERSNVPQKVIFPALVLTPLVIALACTVFAGLPPSIFIGSIAATGVGGIIDVTVFKHMKKYSDKDHVRMSFSNAAGTVSGSIIFFLFAFTSLLEVVAKPFGIDFTNVLNKHDVLGVIQSSQFQAITVWSVGMLIAWAYAGFVKSKGAIAA